MSFLSLKPELRQDNRLLPQMMHSVAILQMNAQELLEHLERLMEENPVLEQEDVSELYGSYEALRQQAGWIDGGVRGAAPLAAQQGLCREQGAPDREIEGLPAFLWDQLERKGLPKPLLSLSKYMAGLLDADGRLEEEDLEALRGLNIPQALICQALETVQSLEPAGVGARSLAECLALQLRRKGTASAAAIEIAERFLPKLERGHYGPILHELGISLEQLRCAQREIAVLEPYPGRAFAPEERTVYIRPDVFILELDGEWKAVLNSFYLPKLSISTYYTHLLKDCQDRETRRYLRGKLQQAQWVMESLERRGATLRRCAQAVLEAQRPFFAGQSRELTPMSLLNLSDELSLHPSTVSRAIRDKYLQCRQGTYPLRFFFSRAVGLQGPSQQAVKQKLLALVQGEDPRHPLSDQRLCQMLADRGVQVARRTVAKYRMELGIGACAVRKR